MKKPKIDKNGDQHSDRINPYILFGAIGGASILISIIFFLLKLDLWEQLFLNLGVSVTVVIIVEYVWRRFGGDPVISAISSLWRATNLLKDLEKSGIISIKIHRTDLDSQEQRDIWRDLLDNATHVDLMAWSMRSQITRHESIMKAIDDAIQSNRCTVRVLTLSPFEDISKCNPLLLQRMNEEKRLPGGEAVIDRVRGNLKDTWSQFNAIKDKYKNDPERNKCIQIKAAEKIMIYTNIIRIDDHMWVSPYSASERGGGNLVFEIAGMHSTLFQRFETEFNHMWNPPPLREEKET